MSSTISLYLFLNLCPFASPLPKSFSKLIVLSGVISLPSTFPLIPSFLALVTVLSISLNLFLFTYTHFGHFNSFDYSPEKKFILKKLINSVNNTQYIITLVIFIFIICTTSFNLRLMLSFAV